MRFAFEAYLLLYNALSTAQLGARGRGWFHFATTIHEQAQSNRACIAFMCDVCLAIFMDSYLLYYYTYHCLVAHVLPTWHNVQFHLLSRIFIDT